MCTGFKGDKRWRLTRDSANCVWVELHTNTNFTHTHTHAHTLTNTHLHSLSARMCNKSYRASDHTHGGSKDRRRIISTVAQCLIDSASYDRQSFAKGSIGDLLIFHTSQPLRRSCVTWGADRRPRKGRDGGFQIGKCLGELMLGRLQTRNGNQCEFFRRG